MPQYTATYYKGRPLTAPSIKAASEYTRAYPTTKNAPRPRNPVPSWSTRNRSNILPSEPESHRPATAQTSQVSRTQQQWPWQRRAIRSEIFNGPPDYNNNPTAPPAVEIPQRYILQRRSQASSGVLMFDRPDPEENEQQRPVRHGRKWPWQERSMQSKIFELPDEKQPKAKSYQWDQRKSSPFFTEDQVPTTTSTNNQKKIHPWQERAQQSNIFKAPEMKSQPGKKYPWDQRQSIFDAKEEEPKFKSVSKYSEDFVKNKSSLTSVEPAGIKSYLAIESLKNLKLSSALNKIVALTEEQTVIKPKEIVPLFDNAENNFKDSSPASLRPSSHLRDRTNSQDKVMVDSLKAAAPPRVPVKQEVLISKKAINDENARAELVDLTN